MRIRNRMEWSPVWTAKIESWTAGQIKVNLWRFDAVTEQFDDVMQEARILFWELKKAYPIVNEPAHFFALYKTSLLRRFTDKSRLKQRSAIDQNTCAEDAANQLQLEGNLPNLGYLSLLLEEAPDELKLVLGALTTGRIRLRLDRPTTSKHPRENHNMRLKRRFSLQTTNPVGDLRSYVNS